MASVGEFSKSLESMKIVCTALNTTLARWTKWFADHQGAAAGPSKSKLASSKSSRAHQQAFSIKIQNAMEEISKASRNAVNMMDEINKEIGSPYVNVSVRDHVIY